MKIDLPVVIVFDCQDTDYLSIRCAAGQTVCTLRFDTGNDGSDALLIQGYPAAKGREKWAESGQPLLAYIPSRVDKKIKDRAERSPYDYLPEYVSEEDRQAAQDKVDAERDPTP